MTTRARYLRVAVVLLAVWAANASQQLPEKEIKALNLLYNALGGPKWPSAERWDQERMNDSEYLCSASYVTCEVKQFGMVVTKLFSKDHKGKLSRPCDLAFRHISGTIPKEVFTDLEHLSVFGAPADSEIMIDADAGPPAGNGPANKVFLPSDELQPNDNLKYLSVCGFFGSKTLPQWFMSHSWRQFEVIYGTHKVDVSALYTSIKALSLRGSAVVNGVDKLRELKGITALDLSSILPGVSRFPSKPLYDLNLDTQQHFYVNMSSSPLETIPTWKLYRAPDHITLDFSNCGAKSVPDSLLMWEGRGDVVVDVNLSRNEIKKIFHRLASPADQNISRALLRIINLSQNHLGILDVYRSLGTLSPNDLSKYSSENRKAMTLDVSRNDLAGLFDDLCYRAFGVFGRLIMSFNKISRFNCTQEARTTRLLDLAHNTLEFIPYESTVGVSHVDVSYNTLLEMDIRDCKEHLDISYNSLSGTKGYGPGALVVCGRNIFAAGNKFTKVSLNTKDGTLPTRVLPTVVDVSHNAITVPFWEKDRETYQAIISLSISGNQINRKNEWNFRDLSNLAWLEAAHNGFSGKVFLPGSSCSGLNLLGNDITALEANSDEAVPKLSMCSLDNLDAVGNLTLADACVNAKSTLCPHIDLKYCNLFPGCKYSAGYLGRPAECIHSDVDHRTLHRICTEKEAFSIAHMQDSFVEESCIEYVDQTPTIDPSCYPGYSAVGELSVSVAKTVATAFVVSQDQAVVLEAGDRRNKAMWTDEGVKRVRDCQEGFFCPRNLQCAVVCQEGSYCPSPNPDVSDFLDDMSVASYSHESKAGSAMSAPCQRGYYCPTTTLRKMCPSGYFCLEGVTQPKECIGLGLQFCPTGSYRPKVGISGWLLYLGIIVFHTLVCFSLQCFHWIYRSLTDKGKVTRISNRINWLMNYIKNNQHLAEEYPIVDMLLPPLPSNSESSDSSQPVNIEFEKLSLHVGSKCILQSVSGALRPQRLTALMGPSGAGKTTLLNVLSSKASYGKSSGTVRINGKLGDLDSIRSVMGFVPQDDILHGNLTCYENIQRSRLLFGPSMDGVLEGLPVVDDPHSGANAILQSLRIAHVADTIVGTTENRGVSGGQRKRVSIGMELAKKPKVLFLDEPTSGLDSTTSLEIVKELKHIAQTRNMTVAAVIHQPRADLMELFDDVVLLAPGGETVYVGPVNEIEDYLKAAGFLYSGRGNIADFILDVVSGSIERERDPVDDMLPRSVSQEIDTGDSNNMVNGTSVGNEGSSVVRSAPIEMQGVAYVPQENLGNTAAAGDLGIDPMDQNPHSTRASPILNEPLLSSTDGAFGQGTHDANSNSDPSDDPVKFLTRRWRSLHHEENPRSRGVEASYSIKDRVRMGLLELATKVKRLRRRDVVRTVVHWFMCLWYALVQETRAWRVTMMHGLLAVVGSCLLGTLSQDLKEEGVVSAINMLLLLSALSGCMASLRVFGDEKEVYWREAASGLFRPSYFLAKDVAVASMVLYVPLSITLGYKLNANPCNAPWLAYYWPVMLIYACGVGSGYILSIAVKMSVGQVGGITLWLIAGMLSGGGTVTLNDMDSFVGVLVSSLSPIRWALEVLVCREFRQWPNITQQRTNKIIDHIGFKNSREALDITMLVIFVFLFRLVAMGALRVFHRGKQV